MCVYKNDVVYRKSIKFQINFYTATWHNLSQNKKGCYWNDTLFTSTEGQTDRRMDGQTGAQDYFICWIKELAFSNLPWMRGVICQITKEHNRGVGHNYSTQKCEDRNSNL